MASSRRGNPDQKKLPTKVCPTCDRPFTWRKKWARDWEHVKYCSKACAKRGGAESAARRGVVGS